jgi:hypothetical protein
MAWSNLTSNPRESTPDNATSYNPMGCGWDRVRTTRRDQSKSADVLRCDSKGTRWEQREDTRMNEDIPPLLR